LNGVSTNKTENSLDNKLSSYIY